MFLVDRHILSSAIHLAGACHHQALHAEVAASLADVESATDVSVDITIRSDVAIRDSNQRGQMQHSVASAHYFAAVVRVAHIATHHFQAVVMHIVEPAPVVE